MSFWVPLVATTAIMVAAALVLPLLVSGFVCHRLLHYPRSVRGGSRVPRQGVGFLCFTPLPDRQGGPLAVLLPGAGVGSPSMKPVAAFYRSRGFEILFIDYPDSFWREGPLGWGPPEAADLARFLATLSRPVLVHGRSFGASVAVLAWGLSGLALTVVSESGFADLPEALEYQALRPYRLLRPFHSLVRFGLRHALNRLKKFGVDAENNRPLLALPSARGTLLLVHGTRDRLVPPHHSIRLYHEARRLGISCRLGLLEGGRHSRLRETDPKTWEEALEWATLAACGKSN